MGELGARTGGIAAIDHAIACEVMLEGLEVQADIGAYAREFGVPQPLRIDVAVTIVMPRADDLAATLDYDTIRGFALDLAARRIALIETFAARLGRQCLAHPGALSVDVRIGKPAAVPGCLAGTRVRLSRR